MDKDVDALKGFGKHIPLRHVREEEMIFGYIDSLFVTDAIGLHTPPPNAKELIFIRHRLQMLVDGSGNQTIHSCNENFLHGLQS